MKKDNNIRARFLLYLLKIATIPHISNALSAMSLTRPNGQKMVSKVWFTEIAIAVTNIIYNKHYRVVFTPL